LAFSYIYPGFPPALFLSTYPTQGMHPFTSLNPLGVAFIYQGLSGASNHEPHCWETQESSLLGKLPGTQKKQLATPVQFSQAFTLHS
jgi:hypothetical protein